jgi:hypothetical protein
MADVVARVVCKLYSDEPILVRQFPCRFRSASAKDEFLKITSSRRTPDADPLQNLQSIQSIDFCQIE